MKTHKKTRILRVFLCLLKSYLLDTGIVLGPLASSAAGATLRASMGFFLR
jgi:hypothetical protein